MTLSKASLLALPIAAALVACGGGGGTTTSLTDQPRNAIPPSAASYVRLANARPKPGSVIQSSRTKNGITIDNISLIKDSDTEFTIKTSDSSISYMEYPGYNSNNFYNIFYRNRREDGLNVGYNDLKMKGSILPSSPMDSTGTTT